MNLELPLIGIVLASLQLIFDKVRSSILMIWDSDIGKEVDAEVLVSRKFLVYADQMNCRPSCEVKDSRRSSIPQRMDFTVFIS